MQNIRVVIFDFDDTLYRGTDWRHWGDFVKCFFTEFLGDENKAICFMKKHKITHKTLGADIVKAMVADFGSGEAFLKYQEENIYPLTLETIKHIKNEELKKLKKCCKLYIVSNSSVRYVKHYLDKFEIDESNFAGIFQNDFVGDNPSKGVAYSNILDIECVEPSQVLVVGDNYNNDIVPALNLGMQGKCINCLESVEEIIERIIKADA